MNRTKATGSMTINFDFEMENVAPTRMVQILQEMKVLDTAVTITDLDIHFETEERGVTRPLPDYDLWVDFDDVTDYNYVCGFMPDPPKEAIAVGKRITVGDYEGNRVEGLVKEITDNWVMVDINE